MRVATGIGANIEAVSKRIASACQRVGRSPAEITIVAVTKTVTLQAITTAFEMGIGHFGENRVQEAAEKIKHLSGLTPRPTWHMVGHLQTNKAKQAVAIFDTVQSVDSVRLAEVLSRCARKTLPVLLEVNIAGEAAKSGFPVVQVAPSLEAISRLPHLEVKGLMTIAPLLADAEQVRPVFRKLRSLRDSLGLEHLSMGMTDDFEVAVEEGATMLRIGRAIFGVRESK
ncbi:YggS family pyridoxal phosphate-dependent enzyme [Chloroflexota bacterium]